MTIVTCFAVHKCGNVTVVDVCNPRKGRSSMFRMYLPTNASIARLRAIYKLDPRRFYVYEGEFAMARKAAVMEIAASRIRASLDSFPTSGGPSPAGRLL